MACKDGCVTSDAAVTLSVAPVDGERVIHVVAYGEDPDDLLDAIQRGVADSALGHRGDSSVSDEIHVIVALTPTIALNRDLFADQLDRMFSFLATEFARKGVGPHKGSSFRPQYRSSVRAPPARARFSG